jgi:DNA-binding transcriptional regulator LsrR (DeoR family)
VAPDDTALASQVARLFHDREMTRVQIAHRLGISRFRVARLLEQARQQGLVRIELRDIPARDRETARAIEEAWGLDLCIVASDGPSDDPVSSVGRLAGSVLHELITPTETIGIAWGSTVAATVAEIPARDAPGISVVQLAGSSARVAQPHDPGELARVLADRLGATCHPLYAPAFVASAEVRAVLLGESEIRRTTDLFGAVTLAIVGIGELSGSRDGSALVRSELLSPDDVRRLRRSGALGDLLVHAFDARGRFIPDPLSDRAVAMTPEQLRRVPRVVAVAGGARKARAIAGALATGIVRMLITDGTAARELLANRGSHGVRGS